MSVNKNNAPLLDPGLCRCCRSIKKCRILTSEYTFMDEREVYADMIMDCFGILLSHIDDNDKDSGVCATCVVRLREAATFKKQVLQSEEVFLQAKLHYKDDLDFNATLGSLSVSVTSHIDYKKALELQLKPEPPDVASEQNSLHSHSDHFDDDLRSAGYSSEDDQKVMDLKPPKKEESEAPPDPPAQPAAPAGPTAPPRSPRSSTDDDDDDDLPLSLKAKASKKTVKKKKTLKTHKNGKITKSKKKSIKDTFGFESDLESVRKTAKKAAKAVKRSIEKKDTTDRDLDYMAEENLLTIVEYSYVCPFKNRRNNYYCYYCKDYYPKPEDLREHTFTHDTKPFQLLMGYKKMPKLDITRIDCRLCSAEINDINAFKTHIEQIHSKKIYHEAPDKLLLYKLTWNNLTCVMCSDVFEDFNGLNTHMVEHFSNYTCDVCGMCFLEKPRLDAHLKRHKDDERHTCEVCGKVFKSNHYKDMHVDIVHKKKAIIRCPRCDECFMSYALKNKHLTEVHGQKRVYPCNLCDKVYNRQKTLTEHQRRNHQKVMKHQCEYCEQRFYLPSRLKEHMATHTGERNFRCEYCEKSYPRLKSLQYHIRTHTNDRRYRCHICGQAFIQNASLKSHIKSHHPECEIEGCYF